MVYPFSTFHSHFSLSAAAAGELSFFSHEKRILAGTHSTRGLYYIPTKEDPSCLPRDKRERESAAIERGVLIPHRDILKKVPPPLLPFLFPPPLLSYYRLPSARLHHHHTFRRWKVSPMPLGKKRGGEKEGRRGFPPPT